MYQQYEGSLEWRDGFPEGPLPLFLSLNCRIMKNSNVIGIDNYHNPTEQIKTPIERVPA